MIKTNWLNGRLINLVAFLFEVFLNWLNQVSYFPGLLLLLVTKTMSLLPLKRKLETECGKASHSQTLYGIQRKI